MGMRIRVSSLSAVGPAAETMTQYIVDHVTQEIDRRAFLAANELRNAEQQVLRGSRSGRWYRGARSQPSAPGEPPASQSGALRREWTPSASGGGGHWIAKITSGVIYANYLENGTRKMAARPMKKPILEKAAPEIRKIFAKSYH